MDFSLTEDQLAIRAAVEKICADFGDEYWLAKDREGGFPHDFHARARRRGLARHRDADGGTAARGSASPKPRS